MMLVNFIDSEEYDLIQYQQPDTVETGLIRPGEYYKYYKAGPEENEALKQNPTLSAPNSSFHYHSEGSNTKKGSTLTQDQIDQIEAKAEEATKAQTPFGKSSHSFQPIIVPFEKKIFLEEKHDILVNIGIGLFLVFCITVIVKKGISK